MKKFILSLIAALTLLPTQLLADEGMWLLQLMRSQNLEEQMRALGLEISVDEIYSPDAPSLKDAIGIFGGGCTGEIVSPNGLIFTNHHCGYSYIQQLSAVEHNYLKDGFWAQDYKDELPCKNINFTFVAEIKDVTDEVNKRIADGKMTLDQSFSAAYLKGLADELFAADDVKDKQYLTAELKPYFEGNKYYLVYYKKYTDVRLVGTPPSSIGKFGGETDNWMWPRHTGDFSIFRVYADENGNPAAYSPDNKPLSTPKHLNISLAGFEPGDYTMIMGFPGSTYRFLTSGEVEARMNVSNAPRIAMRDAALKVIREEMAKSEAVNIQYASKMASISNYWKNSIGMNKAIVDNKVVEKKLANEALFMQFANTVSDDRYKSVVGEINTLVKDNSRMLYLMTLTSELIMNVEFIYRNLNSKVKDAVSTREKAAETFPAVYDWLHNRDYNHEVDRRIAKSVLPCFVSLTTAEERPERLNKTIEKYKGDLDKYIDYVYDNSILSNKKNFDKFMKKPSAKKLDKDPGMQLRDMVFEMYTSLVEKNKAYSSLLKPLHKTYLAGLLQMAAGKPVAPDANFTMRLTYGTVKPYEPRDGVAYKYYTTLKGVMEKENPQNAEFVVPARLKELYNAKDYGQYALPNGEMPVAFLSTNDITGGNSGSGILNSRGELIGLAFDGNWESLSGDIAFDNNLQRCINVDVRYILFVIEKFGNCKRLIDEMTIVK
jgi:hypothetical protein